MPAGIGTLGGISNCNGKLEVDGSEVPAGGVKFGGSVVPPGVAPATNGTKVAPSGKVTLPSVPMDIVRELPSA